jgi:hypothetical protein
MDKQVAVCPCNGMLLSNEKEQTIAWMNFKEHYAG